MTARSITDIDALNSILELPIDVDVRSPGGLKPETVRQYLSGLLSTLWVEGEEFSGKRAWGDSDWQWDLIPALAGAGHIKAEVDEDGYVDSISGDEEATYYGIVNNCIMVLGRSPDSRG